MYILGSDFSDIA